MKRQGLFATASLALLLLSVGTGVVRGTSSTPGIRQQQVPNADVLRQAARLPYLLFEFVFYFSSKQGFTGFGPPGDTAPQVAALQRRLAATVSGEVRAGLNYELGELYQEAQNEDAARAAFAQAVAEYRTLVNADPTKRKWLCRFGKALFAADKTGEAEIVLRAAVKSNPTDARAWDALGFVLLNRAFVLVSPPSNGPSGVFTVSSDREFQVSVSRLLKTKPSADALAQAERLSAEARRCFDRAVEAAPNASTPYLGRAGFRVMGDGYLRLVLRYLGADRTTGAAFAQSQTEGSANGIAKKQLLSDAVLADLWQAARRGADNPHVYGVAALIELYRDAPGGRQVTPGSHVPLTALADEARKRVEEALTHLDALKRKADARVAARAWAMAGALRSAMGDANAEADLRQAIEMNSGSPLSWDMLTGLLIGRGRFGELITLYEERLKHEDSARSRVILAKLYDRLNQPEKVEAQVRSALRLAPEDPFANLAMAAILLKSEKSGECAKAAESLARLERCWKEGKLSADQEAQYRVLSGISLAFSGNAIAARRELERALSLDRNNAEARQALAALPPDTVI